MTTHRGAMWPWSQPPASSSPSFQSGAAFTHTPLPHVTPHPMHVHSLAPQAVSAQFATTQPSFVGYPQPFGEYPHGSVGYGGQLLTAQMAGGWGDGHVHTIQSVPSGRMSEGAGVGYPVQPMDEVALGAPHQVTQPSTPTQTIAQTTPLMQQLVSPQPSGPQPGFPPHANSVTSSPFSVDYILRDQNGSVEAVEMVQPQSYPLAEPQDMHEAVSTQAYAQELHEGEFTDGAESLGTFPPPPALQPSIPARFAQGGNQVATYPHGELAQGRLPFADSADTTLQVPDANTPAFHLQPDFVQPGKPEEAEESMNLPTEEPFSPPELILTEQREQDHSEMSEDRDADVGYLHGTEGKGLSEPPPLVMAVTAGGFQTAENVASAGMETEPDVAPQALTTETCSSDEQSASQDHSIAEVLPEVAGTAPQAPGPSNINSPPHSPTPNKDLSPHPPTTVKDLSSHPTISVRHRHNDTYSSDDDDVFLPNPLPHTHTIERSKPARLLVVQETGGEEPSLSTPNQGKLCCVCTCNSSVHIEWCLIITGVPKRGRRYRNLDETKLQVPLSKG